MSGLALWYIPNWPHAGHRGDVVDGDPNSLEHLVAQATAVERYGWDGALIGTGWRRPDTFTVATALAARTQRFRPLVAARPGYWHPAHFAASAATLDALSGGRLLVNVVSGLDHGGEYGDALTAQPERYARTTEFLQIVRGLWAGQRFSFTGEHFSVADAALPQQPLALPGRAHPTLYFGGASAAAERVAAAYADVQLFWGEPRADIAARIERLQSLAATTRQLAEPLRFGLRTTVVARENAEAAWRAAREKVARLAAAYHPEQGDADRARAIGQRRLDDLAERGEVLDELLYTAPGRVGGRGAATTWLVGSYAEVAAAVERYRELGITDLLLSDTPYLQEVEHLGTRLLPLLRA